MPQWGGGLSVVTVARGVRVIQCGILKQSAAPEGKQN